MWINYNNSLTWNKVTRLYFALGFLIISSNFKGNSSQGYRLCCAYASFFLPAHMMSQQPSAVVPQAGWHESASSNANQARTCTLVKTLPPTVHHRSINTPHPQPHHDRSINNEINFNWTLTSHPTPHHTIQKKSYSQVNKNMRKIKLKKKYKTRKNIRKKTQKLEANYQRVSWNKAYHLLEEKDARPWPAGYFGIHTPIQPSFWWCHQSFSGRFWSPKLTCSTPPLFSGEGAVHTYTRDMRACCLYIYMYMYMYVCMHACMHVRTYVCMYACMHVCMYVRMYVCMHACMYVRMYVRVYVCMHACMYVCTYVCMYVCMHVCTYVCMHACMYVRMYACMHVCMYVCMYACMMHVCMYVRMYVCMHACMYVRMYACMHVCMHACMHACMYVCMYVCLYVCMHACMYVCMHACMHGCMYACMHARMYACMQACMHVCM